MTPLLAHRSRSDRAFERMYRRHVGDVYRYALAVLRNPADAEDVTQTTFLNAYRAFQRGDRPQTAQNWLIRIAHNVCRQRFRQAARRPSEVALNEDLAEAVLPDTEGPSAEDLARALGHLAFNQRSALVMRELEGRSYAEIADTLGLSLSAVETLLFRARRALREQLEEGLSCREAELAISRQLDGRLSRSEGGALRAHLRECGECATFARSHRAQRAAWKGLAAIPVPTSLASFFGGGGAAVGTGAAGAGVGLAAKAAAVAVAAAVAGSAGYHGVKHVRWRADEARSTAGPVAHPHKRPAVSPVPVPSPAPAVRPRTAALGSPAKPIVRPKAKAAPRARPQAPKTQARAKVPPRQAKKAAATLAPAAAAPAPAPAAPAPAAATPAPAVPAAEPAEQAKPAAPTRRGKAVGLARSERAARKKTKPDRQPVGLALSEERSKAKSKSNPNTNAAKAKPASPVQPANGGNGNEKGKKKADASSDSPPAAPAEPAPSDAPPAAPAEPEPNGNGNGNGNGSGNGKKEK